MARIPTKRTKFHLQLENFDIKPARETRIRRIPNRTKERRKKKKARRKMADSQLFRRDNIHLAPEEVKNTEIPFPFPPLCLTTQIRPWFLIERRGNYLLKRDIGEGLPAHSSSRIIKCDGQELNWNTAPDLLSWFPTWYHGYVPRLMRHIALILPFPDGSIPVPMGSYTSPMGFRDGCC